MFSGMQRELFFNDYLEKSKIISVEYYASLLQRLSDEVKKKTTSFGETKILFHHDNVPAHRSVIAMGKIYELSFELLEYPTYSSDLAPSDYRLFLNLK